jgi:hypothetical protein
MWRQIKKQTMKKLILSALLVFVSFIGNTISAQDQASAKGKQNKNRSVDERVKKETQNATTKLGLTEEQKKKWETACKERISANTPVKEKLNGSTTPDERKALHEQINLHNKKFDNAVLSFLNADQKTKYETIKKDTKEKKASRNKKGME